MSADLPPQVDAPRRETRRNLLNVLLGTGLAGWLGTVLYPILRYLSPLEQAQNAGEAVLNETQKNEVVAESFAILPLGNTRVIVLRDPKEKLRALSAVCTHEGCTVQYKSDEGVIWCACHNGRYDLDGHVLSGPPPRPLAQFEVSGSLATKVVVSKESA